ncbi:ultraviolet-B receptor UVR8 isoform X3 [Maniola jurtina]|uniref:ultraviolet-B receptor UVR8 isoform X3 n=1 Tax=Maniola jurtina TaxID=191418 RepID=UPI001E688709|nr:ultraviolet-B receptor UVR8 isoform X3 [Maniola jurtina]
MWCWGANSHGQLGINLTSEQVEKPIEVPTECERAIKQIACGGGHSLLLDAEGKLFSCGWNSRKQLDEVNPTRLHVNACSVSMGLRHTAIINSKGEVWTTGCGRHGQLGLGHDILRSDRFKKVPSLINISHIACGQNHTVAWCNEEKALYVWGDNRYQQLLLTYDKYRHIFKPEKIDIDAKQNVKKIISGWTHFLLWLQDGTLLTWGKNNCGQLGNINYHSGKIFHVTLPDNRKVKDIAIGSEHSLCLADDNTLWAWGWNEHANTGTDIKENNVFLPTRVSTENTSNITGIYAGGAHNFFITDVNQKETDALVVHEE